MIIVNTSVVLRNKKDLENAIKKFEDDWLGPLESVVNEEAVTAITDIINEYRSYIEGDLTDLLDAYEEYEDFQSKVDNGQYFN